MCRNWSDARDSTTLLRLVIYLQKYDRLLTEQGKIQNMAKSELSTQIQILQSQLKQAQLTHEAEKKALESEKERELSRVYNKYVRINIHRQHLSVSVGCVKSGGCAWPRKIAIVRSIECVRVRDAPGYSRAKAFCLYFLVRFVAGWKNYLWRRMI